MSDPDLVARASPPPDQGAVAQGAALPDVDHLFPQKALPDVDQVFDPQVERQRQRRLLGASPVADMIFGNSEVSPLARVLDAFGHGAKDNWGAPHLADDLTDFMRKSGMYNDYDKGQKSFAKTASEVLLWPYVHLLTIPETGVHGLAAATGGVQAAIAQVGEETGQQKLARDIAALPEALPDTGILHAPGLAHDFQVARDLKVVSPGGEAAWNGTRQVAEVPEVERALAAIKQVQAEREAAAKAGGEASPVTPEVPPTVAAPAAPPAPPDIHSVARQLDFQLFGEYDALKERQSTFRNWANEIAAAPPEALTPEKVATHKELEDTLAGIDKRLTELAPDVAKTYQEAQRTIAPTLFHVKQEPQAGAVDATRDVRSGAVASKNTPGVTYIDPRIPEFSPILRDREGNPANLHKYLAIHEQDERAAMAAGMPYDEAHTTRATPAERAAVEADGVDWTAYTHEIDGYLSAIEHEKVTNPPPDPHVDPDAAVDHHKSVNKAQGTGTLESAHVPSGEAAGAAARLAPGPAAPAVSTPSMITGIADTETAKLTRAGRPAEEAEAAAAIIAQHYSDRALRFEGRKGTAAELHAAEAPSVTTEATRFRDAAANRGKQAPGAEASKGGARGPAAKPEAERSVLEELAANGGLKPTPELIGIFGKNKLIPGFGPILRESGLTLDDAVQATKESGHLFDREDIEGGEAKVGHVELLDLIDKEVRGEKQYVHGFEPAHALDVDEQRYRMLGKLETHLADNGIDPATVAEAIKDRAVEIMDREGVTDPGVAYERAVMEEPEYAQAARPVEMTQAEWDAYRADPANAEKAPVHTLDITPQLREAATEQGFPLFQAKRGKIRLRNDGTSTITLFKDADASTFLHETGHQWLEELMRDAREDEAPVDLKADAKTVLDWLGVNSPEDVGVRHHEKFARGFETYVMEGRAPTQALAAVFAKFRDWLIKIYQTVDRLRSPINDDIRGVFDRLLASRPQETVIAPERPSAAGFADIHEADAERLPPPEVYPAMVTAQSERDRIAAAHAPEEEEARLADTGREPAGEGTTGGPPGGAQPDRDGAAAEPVRAEAGTAAQPGALGTGRGEGEGQGIGPSARPRSEVPVDANARFEPSDKGAIDKAGNIRLDKLNGPEDFDLAIREAAERNGGFIAERRGVITDGQALDLADAMGMDPAFLDLKKIGDAFNQQEIIVAKRLLIQSATDVRDLMKQAASGDEHDLMALAGAIARHEMIQGKVAQATAEWGRAGRALNMIIGGQREAADLSRFLQENTGRTLFQLKEMAQYGQRLTTPAQVSKFVADTAGGKIKRAIIFYYVNALISGPITHMRYAAGNALNALFTPLVEIPLAAASGAAREALGFETSGNRVYLGEAGAQLYGLLKGSQDGFRAAVDAWQAGQSAPLPAERVSAQFADHTVNPIPGPIGTTIGVPGRAVAAIHSFFKSLRYEQNIQGLAYRQAMRESLSGDAAAGRIAQLTSTPTQAMMESATKDALKELFMAPTEYHSFSGMLTRATNTSLIAKIIVPFMKIGSQITRNALIERTPLGVLDKEFRANVALENGGAQFDVQMGKVAAGTALIGSTVLMAAEGLATGDGPEDPRQRAVWLLDHKPNHIQIGSVSIPYQGLGHIGMLMRFSANMYETAHAWNGEDGDKLAIAFMQGISKSILDDNFMRGAKDLLDAVYHPEEYGEQYLKGFVTNWIPYSVGLGQVAREVDPYQREARTIFDAARAKIPFVSEGLMPRRDMFGQPIPTSGPLPAYANDPVVKTMDALHFSVGRLERKIRGVELTEQQFDDYARVAGRMAKMQLNMLVGTPGFQQMPDVMKVQRMHEIINGARETARNMVMMQSAGGPNNIIQKASEAKRAPLLVPPTVH